MQRLEEHLLKNLGRFTAFARSRVRDPHLAADVVQESLLKALKSAGQLRENENLTAWFYRILRHTVIDLYRRRDAAQRALERWERNLEEPPSAAETRAACACISLLVPTLKPEYAALIRELDLAEHAPERVAAQRGVTLNNLRVQHHRARRQLRARLLATCRLCAQHGCLDCTCGQ